MLIVFRENNCSYMVTVPILSVSPGYDHIDLMAKENLNITGLNDKHTIIGASDSSYDFDIIRTNKNKINPKVTVGNMLSIYYYLREECENRFYEFDDDKHRFDNKYAIANNDKIVVFYNENLSYEVLDYEILDNGDYEGEIKPLIASNSGSLKYRIIKALRQYMIHLPSDETSIIMVNTNDKAIEIINPSDDIEYLK